MSTSPHPTFQIPHPNVVSQAHVRLPQSAKPAEKLGIHSLVCSRLGLERTNGMEERANVGNREAGGRSAHDV
jgi:hypothetical protein